jgi:hypothetical protein
MKRIDDKTVEFTDDEQKVKDVFDLMLVEGIDVTTATRYSVTAMPKGKAKANFIEYLSDGTLTKVKGEVVEKVA